MDQYFAGPNIRTIFAVSNQFNTNKRIKIDRNNSNNQKIGKMMKNRDYSLIKNGKYNMKAIMQRSWVYVRNYKYSLKDALYVSWVDASLSMDEYVASLKPKKIEQKQGNILKSFFLSGHPDNVNYDSSWR